tara:strand:+ start:7068 stop:8591 length:1524 start_codon:yes stop_codon:yes gene_type:complete
MILSITIINAQNDMTVLFQYFDESVDIYVDGDEIVINADGVPSHLSPYFPETYNDSENGLYFFEDLDGNGINDWYIDPHNGMNVNPNQIGLHDYDFRIPLNPVVNPDGPTDTFLGSIGVSLNGVPLYNEYEGPVDQLNNGTILSFDLAQGHPAPGGLYHYHFPPESLFVASEDNFIGFAADGFPVYGPKNMDGYNVEDLDDLHAEYGPTPDFPDSIYHYHTTYTTPYIIGAFAGTIGTGFGGGGGGGGGGGVIDCQDALPGQPCCGDGICGGPETEDNCPVDCGAGDAGPSLVSFILSADTVNTSEDTIAVGYIFEAADSANSLLSYSVRLIINGGMMGGGEVIVSDGAFPDSLMTSSVAGILELPQGATEGHWNVRVVLRNVLESVNNIGPNDLEEQGFQNYIFVENEVLSSDFIKYVPENFGIIKSYPNPFNPVVTISFAVPSSTDVKMTIYNIIGKQVGIILNKEIFTGVQYVTWDAKNQPSGVYFIKMTSDKFTETQKVILLK